ncbi:MAG: aldose 1-epimerase family protein [Candidatus Brocadiaceae bacterium]|nr:aldose 1-epimerase family protein [Candidatus Brocadiaceae bacterium]
MASYFQCVLTDSGEGVWLDEQELSAGSFIGYDGPPWVMEKTTLVGGKQHGVDVVRIDNGRMTVVVCPTRGMGILEAFTDEAALAWKGPVREVVHPAFVREETQGGLGWVAGFSEFVCRCGLSYNGAPGEDLIRTNTGAEKRVTLPLHGTIANCPANRVRLRVQLQPPYELSVVGELRDARMFGPSWELATTLSTVPGSRTFRVSDVVRNVSAETQEMELLYHCNYGAPVLAAGTEVVAPVEHVCPRDARAAEDIGTWNVYGPPTAGFAEQCYYMRVLSAAGGRTLVGLLNPAEALAASIRYSVDQLPALTLWRNSAAEVDGYVTALEPGTDYPNGRGFERSKGRVVRVPAGATYRTELDYSILVGRDELDGLRAEVRAIAAGRRPRVSDRPEPEYCPD